MREVCMDYNQLRLVVEVVETGSISKAANNLFISQPNLSSQIASLEDEIGKKLFTRSNRGMTLTPYGVEVYNQAKTVVKQYEIVEKKLMNKSNDNKIKIASFGSEIINEEFFEVCSKYSSNCLFELRDCSVEESIQNVMNRDCDIALILYSDLQQKKITQFLSAEKLELRCLFEGDLRIHVSKKSQLSVKEVITKSDIQNLLHVQKSFLFDGMFGFHLELEHLDLPDHDKVLLTNDIKTYHDALHRLSSFGIEIDWKCNKHLPSDFARIPYDNKKLKVYCGVVKRENEILKEALEYFIDRLIKAYR